MQQKSKNNKEVDRMDELVPPVEMMFDGATSAEKFKDIGFGFTHYFLIEHAELKPNEKILDVGCGIGQKARVLTKYINQDGTYYGFDIVPMGIEWCKKNYSRYKNFHFQIADVYNKHYNPGGTIRSSKYRFPYPEGLFDVVFASSVFTHMLPQDMERYLEEIARVMKRKGRCVITYFLLNPESLGGINARTNIIEFPFDFNKRKCRIAKKDNPETTISYDENFVRGLYMKKGLSITEISYGNWSGRKEYKGLLQDAIIAVKS